jgi:hypothetical protein
VKKTTLYKLVKQALREVIRESKDLQLANKYLSKYEKLTNGEKSNITNEILREQREQAKKDSPVGLAQFSKAKIKEIYDFLVKNDKAKVSFKEISNDPLLKGINIDGLEVIYLQIVNLSLEEFTEALQELFMTTTCDPSEIVDYGSINIYLSNGCDPIEIPQDFICCSATNTSTTDGPGGQAWLTVIGIGVSGQGNCYTMPPPNPPNSTTSQFTIDHFFHYWAGITTGANLITNPGTYSTGGQAGAGDGGWPYASNPNAVLTNGSDACIGCAHPDTLNYNPSHLGCDTNGNGVATLDNISCCTFEGCGAVNTFPPAIFLTSIPDVTINNTLITVETNEEQPYWQDSGNCEFPEGCYQTSFSLLLPNSQTFANFVPNNVAFGMPTSYSGVVSNLPNYALGGIPGDSNYVITPTPLNSTGCVLEVCTDPSASNYVGLAGTYAGYNIDSAPSGTIYQCQYDPISGCTDASASNYNQYATVNDGSCIFTGLEGCMDPNANWNSTSGGQSYNPLATIPCNISNTPISNTPNQNTLTTLAEQLNSNNSCCGYQACWEPTNPNTSALHINYACNTGLLPDLSYLCSNGVPDTTLGVFDTDLYLCIQEIPGCTDSTMYNYNPLANIDDGTCIAVVNGCMDDLATNYNAAANTDDGTCTYISGCTYPGSSNYNPLATQATQCYYDGCVDDGSQYTAILYPNWLADESPWDNYVCVDPLNQTSITAINPLTGYMETHTRAEWLCGCGSNSNPTIVCDATSNPITGNYAYVNGVNLSVEFIDNLLFPPTDTDSYNAFNPAGPFGSCVGNNTSNVGCTNSLAGNYNPNATQDDDCYFYYCTDSSALNYVCIDEPSLCDQSGALGTFDTSLGTLLPSNQASIPFECEYPESYNCGNIDTNTGLSSTGCVNPGDGTGIYTSLGDCESDCTEISYNCSEDGTGCVDPGNGTGTYTLATAFNNNFLQNYPFEDYGDPLGQCQDTCGEEYFECDSTYGCYSTSATSQPQGSFETLAECQIKCTSYNCNEQTGCTPAPPNTIGTYTGTPNSLTPIAPIDQCQDECKECSMVSAEKCLNPAITKDFTCLEIDGFNGDPTVTAALQLPNTSISSPYGIEQYFKDTPSSPIVAEQIKTKLLTRDPQEPAYSSTTWKVTAINNIFSTLPHTLRNSSTCYEGYNCGIEAGICYGTGTQIGSYTGPDAQTDCESNCSPITFNCNNGVCVDPGDGTGTYTYTTATANGFTGAQEECEGWGLSATGQPFSGTSLPIGYNVLSPAFLSALTSGITDQTLLDYFNNLDLKDEYGEPNCGPSIGIDPEGCLKGCIQNIYHNYDPRHGYCCDSFTYAPGQILQHDQSCCAFPTNSTNTIGIGTQAGGTTCFTGKTPIIMEDETLKRIDEIIVGDIVKSEINTSKVIGIDIHKEEEYTIYSINNSEAFVTAEHPFKTTTGWKAIDPLETFKKHGIESNVLEIGNILITKEGTEEVKSITVSKEKTNVVYNLQLDNEHVYYANGYLVHNDITAKGPRDPIGPIDSDGSGYLGGGFPGGDFNPKMAPPGGNTTPFITPDTPIIQESKLLRNLFKKEFMNASKPNSKAKLKEAIKRMLKNKK